MRTYNTPIGKVPSVTTILDAAMSSYYLPQWAADLEREMCIEQYRICEEKNIDGFVEVDFIALVETKRNVHKTALKDAGDIGSLVHNMIDCWNLNLFNGTSEDYLLFLSEYYHVNAIKMLSAWFQCIKDNNIKILKSEMTVWHFKGFAGTLDSIASIGEDGAVMVGDWKTSSAIYIKHWIQIEAYRRAYSQMTKEEPVGRFIVRLCKEENKLGTYELIIRPLVGNHEIRKFFDGRKKKYVEQLREIKSDHETDWKSFLACKDIFDRIQLG